MRFLLYYLWPIVIEGDVNIMAIKLPLGKDIFPKVRTEGCYYIDKTPIIQKISEASFDVLLITRPRRFGKSLTISMLEDFFDIGRDSRADFAGLKISEDRALCDAWMNQWPVVSLTLKGVEGLTFKEAYGMLEVLTADICKKYAFLGSSSLTDEDDRVLFKKLKAQEGARKNVKQCISLLIRMMYAHYGKPVIVLIDEYDVPLAKAEENGYYREMLDVIRALFGSLKTNSYLKFAIVTGCLKIAKESIFTGANIFVEDSITGNKLAEYIGFTQADVARLLEDSGFTSHAEEIREWYDGYMFGSVSVYCPWDVLSHLDALEGDPEKEPKGYWLNTSGNAIVKRLLKKAGGSETVRNEIGLLVDGRSIKKRISSQVTYSEIDKSVNNLWSILYLTGYLTKKGETGNGVSELAIPNREIHDIFISHITEWFTATVSKSRRKQLDALCDALKQGDAEKAGECFDSILKNGISIRDTAVRKSKKENFYHGILLGLLMCVDDWYVHSNVEDGDGYSDIHVEIQGEDMAFVIEVKYAEKDRLEARCREALQQIRDMRYLDGLKEEGFSTIYAYGIACFRKHCMVVCETV